jgi:glycosyltransferase involved in cell wall biosynthesis
MEMSRDSTVRIPSIAMLDTVAPHTWYLAAKQIRRFKPEILLFNYWIPFFAPCFGSIVRLVKNKMQVKIGYICHNVVPHESRFADRALTRWALSNADFFIVQSRIVEEQLLSLLPEARYLLVPHPVYNVYGELLDKQSARARLGLKSEKVILFFGYIREYKGLDLLLQAMPRILQKHPATLMVAGEFYQDERKYRSMIETLGITGQVVIYGNYIPNESVNLYFSAADVVVLPYKSATQSGIVQMACHFNKPCIVTNVGGLAEMVFNNETGFVVEPNQPEAISGAVNRYYEDDCESRFSDKIKKVKTRFSWDNLVDAIVTLAN